MKRYMKERKLAEGFKSQRGFVHPMMSSFEINSFTHHANFKTTPNTNFSALAKNSENNDNIQKHIHNFLKSQQQQGANNNPSLSMNQKGFKVARIVNIKQSVPQQRMQPQQQQQQQQQHQLHLHQLMNPTDVEIAEIEQQLPQQSKFIGENNNRMILQSFSSSKSDINNLLNNSSPSRLSPISDCPISISETNSTSSAASPVENSKLTLLATSAQWVAENETKVQCYSPTVSTASSFVFPASVLLSPNHEALMGSPLRSAHDPQAQRKADISFLLNM